MKVKLTKRFIDSVPYAEKGTDVYTDTELTGFALRVGKQTKRYTLNKRINNKLYRDEVEETHLITLTEARTKASIMISNIKKGLDVYDGLHVVDESDNDEVTVPTLLEAYNYFLSMKTKLSTNTLKFYNLHMSNHFSDWHDIKLNDITKNMVSEKHKKISAKSESQANASMRTLRAVWNYCQDSYLDEDEEPIIKNCPVKILSSKKDWNVIKPRTGHVEEEYIPKYFRTLIDYVDRSSFKQASHSNNTRDVLLIYLFTGVRLNEALPLEWKDVDTDAGRILFRATKNGSDYPMPVGKILHAMLIERRRLSEGNKYVFPSCFQKLDQPVKELRKGYDAVAEKSGVKVTPHDLRRTFGTVANSIDVNYPVLKKLLNHREAKASDDVTLQYVQVSQRQLREALNNIELYYCSKVNMTQDEVIARLLTASSR